MVISSFFKESASGNMRADVLVEGSEYQIRYYGLDGSCFKSVNLPGKNLTQAENIAEEWALGVKNLYG